MNLPSVIAGTAGMVECGMWNGVLCYCYVMFKWTSVRTHRRSGAEVGPIARVHCVNEGMKGRPVGATGGGARRGGRVSDAIMLQAFCCLAGGV
jgi:hypothetical protein